MLIMNEIRKHDRYQFSSSYLYPCHQFQHSLIILLKVHVIFIQYHFDMYHYSLADKGRLRKYVFLKWPLSSLIATAVRFLSNRCRGEFAIIFKAIQYVYIIYIICYVLHCMYICISNMSL